MKSSLESKLLSPQDSSDNNVSGSVDGTYSTDINITNKRPPLLRNTGILEIQGPVASQSKAGVGGEVRAEGGGEGGEGGVAGKIPVLQIPSSSSFSKAIHIVGKYCSVRFTALYCPSRLNFEVYKCTMYSPDCLVTIVIPFVFFIC